MTDIDEDPYGYVATREACIKYTMGVDKYQHSNYWQSLIHTDYSARQCPMARISVNLEISVALAVLTNLGIWMTSKGFLRRDIFAL